MSSRAFLVAALLALGACKSGGSSTGDARTDHASSTGVACPKGLAEGFTACVHACGESTDKEDFAATCAADGTLECPSGTHAAAECGAGSWPSGPFAGCGPWVNGVDCQTAAVCVDGFWTCPGPDAAAD